MASITNNHRTALRLPSGGVLNPGVATNVDKWDDAVKNKVVARWVERGVLTVGEGKVSAADEKAQIRERLDELNVDYNKSLGVAKLREVLADAEAERDEG